MSLAVPGPYSEVSTALLLAELRRRQDASEKPECGSEGHRGTYNLPIHVFALVLILVLSTAGKRTRLHRCHQNMLIKC